MATYKNPWYVPGQSYSMETFTCNVKPIFHAGCEIYKRHKDHFDVVKSGVCIAQRAGLENAKRCAEAVNGITSQDDLEAWVKAWKLV